MSVMVLTSRGTYKGVYVKNIYTFHSVFGLQSPWRLKERKSLKLTLQLPSATNQRHRHFSSQTCPQAEQTETQSELITSKPEDRGQGVS